MRRRGDGARGRGGVVLGEEAAGQQATGRGGWRRQEDAVAATGMGMEATGRSCGGARGGASPREQCRQGGAARRWERALPGGGRARGAGGLRRRRRLRRVEREGVEIGRASCRERV